MKVKVYTRTHCSYCVMAKNLLTARNIPFEEIDLTDQQELRDKIARPHHWHTLPMIFIDDDFVGGFRELHELDKSGGLKTRS